jgi:glycosyltransferase involved in cell wall biosynthesis
MLAIVMPVFNESDGIENFVIEINSVFQNIEFNIFIIDDYSSDNTPSLLKELKSKKQIGDWKRNIENLGHGPSTLNALAEGINSKADYIIAVDGDGQFQARDMLKIYNQLLHGFGVVEGVRIKRNEPYFRKLVTFGVRALVFSRTWRIPKDANTPLRGYQLDTAKIVMKRLSKNTPIPNLLISVLTRKEKFLMSEVLVTSLPRRGNSQIGTTWGSKNQLLPSKRFVQFCIKSLKHWAQTP